VAVGVTLVVPLAKTDVYPPGLMLMVVAPVVAQARVLLPPALMPAGLAAKEAMVGDVTLPEVGPLTAPAQPAAIHTAKAKVARTK
jgi:hypothetical protein